MRLNFSLFPLFLWLSSYGIIFVYHHKNSRIMVVLSSIFASIWQKIKKKENGKTFGQVLEEYLLRLNVEERSKSYKLYRIAGSKFLAFMEGDFALSLLMPEQIEAYAKFLYKQGLSDTSIRIYLILLKTLVNYAIKLGYVSFRIHPFVLLKIPAASTRELDLSVAEIKQIRDVPLTKTLYRYARDVFMLTYYLGGINLRDLTEYNFNNQSEMRYIRHKTRQTKKNENLIVFTIQPEALEIIQRYKGTDGHLHFGPYHTYEKVYSMVYRYLPFVAIEAGITKKVTYYSARKSFAQHGYELGIQLEQIEYCLGHSMKSNRPIFNYIRIMRERADGVFRLILDDLK